MWLKPFCDYSFNRLSQKRKNNHKAHKGFAQSSQIEKELCFNFAFVVFSLCAFRFAVAFKQLMK